MKDGEVGTGNWAHVRWCNTCSGYHGMLYVCPDYPEDVKQMLREKGDQFLKDVHDPEWIKKQMDNGATPEAIGIMRAFAGPRRN